MANSESKIKISAATIIRNGVKFEYPFIESLRSVLPLVDEIVINVGKGEDETLNQIKKFSDQEGNEKVKIFESIWPLDDPEQKKSGKILSDQTNLALQRCTNDWCIYLQADEILHQDDYPKIRSTIEMANARPEVEGLLFDYLHFYGSFDVVQVSRSAYRREVRAIRKSSTALSVGDAQSFRLINGDKLKVIHTGAKVYHYGWVRSPEAMKSKTEFFDTLYAGGGDHSTGDNYRYKKFWGLTHFKGTHPEVMKKRIADKGWHWDLDSSPWVWHLSDLKKILLDTIEKATGIRLFEYRSYKLIS